MGLNDGTFKWIGMEQQEVLSVEEVKFHTVYKKERQQQETVSVFKTKLFLMFISKRWSFPKLGWCV